MLGRNTKQYGQALVGTFLVLTRHIELHILVTVAPVSRKAFSDARGSFGEQPEHNILSVMYDFPSLRSPFIGFFNEKVSGQPHIQLAPWRDLERAFPVTLQGQRKVLGAEHL